MDDSLFPETQTQRSSQLSQKLFQDPWLKVLRGQKRSKDIMDEEFELVETQTQTQSQPTQSQPLSLSNELMQQIQVIQAPWGRLYPCLDKLEAIDLIQNSYLVGRGSDCNVTINETVGFPPNQCLMISNKHFSITKERGCPAVITDTSKNGTYINGQLIGRGKRHILSDDDIICIGHRDLKAYVFKPMDVDDNYLPYALRQKYVLSKPLGKGGCGEVRLVFNRVTTKQYAVKRMVKAGKSSYAKLNHPSRINSEIEILKLLKHHFIISMKEIVETDDEIFLILELMKGGELTNLIDNRLTESQAKFLFYQIVQGVDYLHRNGVIHRDLKAENILLSNLSPDALVKITDFGLSKIIDEATSLKTTCGTSYYVAPEIIGPLFDNYTPQVDIWSLGVILYYMLSGHLPFLHSEKEKLHKLIINEIYEFDNESWMGISEIAKDLVRRMLTVNPDRRIKIKEIYNHPWIADDTAMQYKVNECVQKYLSDRDDDETFIEPKRPRLDCNATV